MGNFKTFGKLVKEVGGRVTIQIQDAAPIEVERYYPMLFNEMERLDGIMLATFVADTVGQTFEGGTDAVQWDAIETADRIVKTVRECVRKKLSGQSLV